MLKLHLNYLLCLSIFSLLCVALVKCVCVVQYPDDIEMAPIFTRHYGRFALELPYTRSDIILQDGESIQAKCRTTFSLIRKRGFHYTDSRNHDSRNGMKSNSLITLKCMESRLYLENNIVEDYVIRCRKLNWTLYENLKEQNWCKQDAELVAPLVFATESGLPRYVLAEICFDLNNWSLQAITYNVTFPNENIEMLRNIHKTKLQTAPTLGENLRNLKSTHNYDLTEDDLQGQLKEMSRRNFWLHLANYELSPIIQGKSYENYFKEYSNILNTIWWSNLRLGNWKRFMDTLENYAYNNSFQLYVGTSGVVRKPVSSIADLSKDLTIKFGFKEKPVPAYIWSYLTSTDKTNRDFVIAAYNSPYAEFFPREEIIFCDDMCNEIPWLQGIADSFKYNTAGIMFCCSPESMQHINILNGFPMEVLLYRENSKTNFNQTSTEHSTILDAEIISTTLPYNEIKSEELAENYVDGVRGEYDEERNEDY